MESEQSTQFLTTKDKFILSIGVLSALITGALQPAVSILCGDFAGSIATYASTLPKEKNGPEYDKAVKYLMTAVKNFALYNCLLGVVVMIYSYISIIAFNYSAIKQVFLVRCAYFSKILNQDIAWHDLKKTNDFANKMNNDLYKYVDGIGEKITLFIHCQTAFVVSLIVALVRNYNLTMRCLASVPACLTAFIFVSEITFVLAQNEIEAYASAGLIAEEVLSSINTVVAFGGQEKEAKRYEKYLAIARKNNILRYFLVGITVGLLWFIVIVGLGLSFIYEAKFLLDQHGYSAYNVATTVTVFQSVMTGSMNFTVSSALLQTFNIAKAACCKTFNIIESKAIIQSSKNKGDIIDPFFGRINFCNVQFNYPSRRDTVVLQNLNFEIRSGETVAITGDTGCGKSTIIKLIQRFYDPISGEIQLDGKNLKDLNLSWVRQNIGVVEQKPVLFNISIRENIRLACKNATEGNIIQAAKQANAHSFIKKLPKKYDTLIGEKGLQLSLGQKQSIAIARALIKKPIILLLDEPTSALDQDNQNKILDSLNLFNKECTTILITNKLSTIQKADKIMILSNGQVDEEGTHEELMSLKQKYYQMVMIQLLRKKKDLIKAPVTSPSIVSMFSTVYLDEDEDKEKESDVLDDDDGILPKKEEEVSFLELVNLNLPESIPLIIGSVCSLIIGCSWPIFAFFLSNTLGNPVFDRELLKKEFDKYSPYFYWVGVVMMFSAIFQILSFGFAGEKVTERVRRQMFRFVLKQDMEYFDARENSVGGICTILTANASRIQLVTGQKACVIIESMSTFITSLAFVFYLQWKLGLVISAFMPFIFMSFFLETGVAAQIKIRDKALEKTCKIAVEAINNIQTIVSYNMEDEIFKLYVTELNGFYVSSKKMLSWRGAIFGIFRSLMLFAYAVAMFYGGFLIKFGTPYMEIFKVSIVLLMSTSSIANSLAFAPNYNRSLESARRIVKLLARTPRIIDDKNAKNLIPTDQTDVEFSNVFFSYPSRKSVSVLNGINLRFSQGQIVALIGSNGCGKFTIIKLLERFYDPDMGDIIIDDENIKNIRLGSLRHHIGIVSQEPTLFCNTITENIAYGNNSRSVQMSEIIAAAKIVNIHDFIVSLPMGYETEIGNKGSQLSHRQKQKIAMARLLIKNPKILVLYENTLELDYEYQEMIRMQLTSMKDDRIIIIIANNLIFTEDVDMVYVIGDGEVVVADTPEELLRMKEFLNLKVLNGSIDNV